MRVDNNPLGYVPLIDPPIVDNKPPPPNDKSLLVTTPEEIQRNLDQWRDQNERLHIVV